MTLIKTVKTHQKPLRHAIKRDTRAWEALRGAWENRKPNPIKELERIRKEWDRKLP